MSTASLGARQRADLFARCAKFGLHMAIVMCLATTAFSITIDVRSAKAAEQYDFEWDPSGIFTRTMRENARRARRSSRRHDGRYDEYRPRKRSRRRVRKNRRKSRRYRSARTKRLIRIKRKKRQRGRRVASLGTNSLPARPKSSISSASSAGRIIWRARRSCLNPRLRRIIAAVASKYGRVRVNSTCRSRRHNRRVGGAPRSRHLTGDAADIRIFGKWRAARSYLRRAAGGYIHYGGGLFHIDTGRRRRF